MPQPKFQLYKHIKIRGKWRYSRAAIYSNGKVKLHVVVVCGQEEKHEEGSYCIRHKKSWIEVGTDPLEAQRMRSKLVDQTEYTVVQPAAMTNTSLAQASEKYFTNLEARGLDAKSIRAYRTLFPNRKGKSNQHLLQVLQRLAKKNGCGIPHGTTQTAHD